MKDPNKKQEIKQTFHTPPVFDAYDKNSAIQDALGSSRKVTRFEVGEVRSANWIEGVSGWKLTPLGLILGSTSSVFPAGSITVADIQNISTGRLLGRTTAGDGSIEQLTAGNGLDLSSGSLSAKVQMSVTADGSGLKLSGDATTPGNNQFYGTNGSGTKGWYALPGATQFSAYAAGTAYQLTNTAALLDFGTTDPSITITTAGTYLLLARVRIDYNGATFAANRTVTLKIRRTNNTAADVSNSSTGFLTDIITTLTYTAGEIALPPVIYTTTNTNDILQIYGSIDTTPTAGSIDAVAAEIIAIRLL